MMQSLKSTLAFGALALSSCVQNPQYSGYPIRSGEVFEHYDLQQAARMNLLTILNECGINIYNGGAKKYLDHCSQWAVAECGGEVRHQPMNPPNLIFLTENEKQRECTSEKYIQCLDDIAADFSQRISCQ